MAEPDPVDAPSDGAPVRSRRPLSVRWWIAVAVVIVVYVLVNVIYGFSTSQPEPPPAGSGERVTVNLIPVAVVPMEDKIRLSVLIEPPSELFSEAGLTQQVTVNLVSLPKDVTFAKGSRALSTEIDVLATEGTYESYPFDRYQLDILATVTTQGPDGEQTIIPSEFVVWGKFPGWRVQPVDSRDDSSGQLASWRIPADAAEDLEAGRVVLTQVQITRNGSTLTIVVILLAAMVLLTGIALVVARSVATRRRRIEATMASWFAALLFAMVPLRTNLPGAPPIGVWIDFLVFLWVILGLMVALSLFVGSWLRYSDPPAVVARKP